MFDIIGDIHGYADTLTTLLYSLGYESSKGYFHHPTRKVIFLGDFIDRGPQIRKTLSIVKNMVDNGSAQAVLGNHEYNAICYFTRDNDGNFLRPHTDKNIRQFRHTLQDFKNYREELEYYINWFSTLPLFLDFEKFRIVHACWDNSIIDFIKKELPLHRLNSKFLIQSAKNNTPEYDAIEILLKGKELKLPTNFVFVDRDGVQRKSIRIKWWQKFNSETYRSVAVNFESSLPDVLIPENTFEHHAPYHLSEPPVFIGHYWKRGIPQLLASNVCCVDYSVAKNGKLCAYRWDDESILDNNKFVIVRNCD